MYKICVLVDKFYRFGGGEIFLEDLINNSSKKLDFRYLISLEKPKNTYQNPLDLPLASRSPLHDWIRNEIERG